MARDGATTRELADNFLAEALDEMQDCSEIPWRVQNAPELSGEFVCSRATTGMSPVEVGLAIADSAPTAEEMRRLWRDRGRGVSGFVVAVLYGTRAAIMGPSEDDEILSDQDPSAVERICAEVLRQSSSLDAANRARSMIRDLGGAESSGSPGIRDNGLFAKHQLFSGVPATPGWAGECARGSELLSCTGRTLLSRLGFRIEPGAAPLDLLTATTEAGAVEVVAALLQADESFNRVSSRFNNENPIIHAQRAAVARGVDWVISVSGRCIRLYPTKQSQTLAGGGLVDRYLQLDLAQLTPGDAGYLTYFFAPDAFVPGGAIEVVAQQSRTRAVDLLDRLRDRIYEDVMPILSVGVANAMGARTPAKLTIAYHRSLVILFRMIFLAYAEHEGLLPLQSSAAYRKASVAAIARELIDRPDELNQPGKTNLWERMTRLWRAVDGGDPELNVPAYNGGLFAERGTASGVEWNPELVVTDDVLAPVLTALLVDEWRGDHGPVDFQSLDVTAFGTLYEGLLEAELSHAEQDLVIEATRKDGEVFAPATTPDAEPVIRAGEVYFHTASGARKSTGSYFTPPFAVDYLLDRTLEPALDDHLENIDALIRAGEMSGEEVVARLFDFRVIDPAMGSAHFLVGAVDRIGTRFRDFLADHRLDPLEQELDHLSHLAEDNLREVGVEPADLEIAGGTIGITADRILRRQIARRCIYGIELNPMAAELARLAIWIRTFVPGLPMSNMNRTLVHGNSLIGITRIEEAVEWASPAEAKSGDSLFTDGLMDMLGVAAARLRRLAMAAEGTIAEIRRAQEEYDATVEELRNVRTYFDAALYRMLYIGDSRKVRDTLRNLDPTAAKITPEGEEELAPLHRLHLPLVFPEVMTRERPGFDVVLGNPPWEKVKVEEHQWWSIRIPGLRSMTQREKNASITRHKKERPDLLAQFNEEVAVAKQMRSLIKNGPYPLGAGDTDLYKLFCWRDWDLARDTGRVGIVVPRAALAGAGTAKWRTTVVEGGSFEDVCTIVNNGGWLFEGVHPQYTVALVSIRKGDGDQVRFHGPYYSRAEFNEVANIEGHRLHAKDNDLVVSASEELFLDWSADAAFPLLPDAGCSRLFRKLRQSPTFVKASVAKEFKFVRELDTTDNKELMDFNLDSPNGDLEVWTGRTFNLWDPCYGEPYATADRGTVEAFLIKRRMKQIRRSNGAFAGFDGDWAADRSTLPMHRPRIAFRDVARATDSRTMIPCLVPPVVGLVHKAPYLFDRTQNAANQALVLGVLTSRSFDWTARRYVEATVSKGILSALPFPAVESHGDLERRLIINSARLAAVDDRYADWADEVERTLGEKIGVGTAVDEDIREDLIVDNEAIVSLLYGLDDELLRTLYSTFHRGWDFEPELTRVLTHRRRLAKEGLA